MNTTLRPDARKADFLSNLVGGCIIIGLLLFFIVRFIPFSHQRDATPAISGIVLDKGWEYRWGDFFVTHGVAPSTYASDPDWRTLETFPSMPPGRGGSDFLWLRIRLPHMVLKDPALSVKGIIVAADIFLDDTMIAAFGNPTQKKQGGVKSLIIDLPAEFGGGYVYFRVFSNIFFIGIQDPVVLDSRAHIISDIVKNDLDKAALSAVFFFIGITALILLLRYRRNALLFFGIAALAVGVYTLKYSDIKEFIIDNPFVWHYGWIFSLASFPVCLTGFYFFSFRDYIELKREFFFKSLLAINGLVSLGFAVLILVDIALRAANSAVDLFFTLSIVRFLTHFVLIIDFAILFIHSCALSIRGYTMAKIYTLGLAILLLFTGNEILAALVIKIRLRFYTSLLHWGMFGFILTLIYILAVHFSEVDRRFTRIRDELFIAKRIQEAVVDAPVLLLDTSLRIVMANARTERLTEKKSSELMECDPDRVIDEYEVVRKLAPDLFSGKQRNLNFRFHFSNLKSVPIDARISLIKNRDDACYGLLIQGNEVRGAADLKNEYHLTEREMEIIQYILAGDSHGEIAHTLSITERTVKTHVTNIYNKLTVNNKIELFNRLSRFNLKPRVQFADSDSDVEIKGPGSFISS